jgi:hypothetical protein
MATGTRAGAPGDLRAIYYKTWSAGADIGADHVLISRSGAGRIGFMALGRAGVGVVRASQGGPCGGAAALGCEGLLTPTA